MSMSQVTATPGSRRDEASGTKVIAGRVEALRRVFESGRTRSLAWRLQQLAGLRRMLVEREREILAALHADVGKPELEAWAAEVHFVAGEIDLIEKHLADWMKPERVPTPLVVMPGTSRIHKEPLGVVLIIGPWNYPFQLVMGPLVGALSAGNCAVLKPSEVAPETSRLLARWLPEYIDPDCVAVVEGAVAETTALLEQRFDHIFYTGNGSVGRIVMTAAARHLTPVTLELGGKSPTIVDRGTDLDVAARRIAWGKFYNAGQTCIAPDYVLVHESLERPLLDKLRATVRQFYGADPRSSADYARIVNGRHHQRLMRLVPSGEPFVGGDAVESERYLAPTVLTKVAKDSPVMADEIFGPILPVLPVASVDEAIRFVNDRPKPLALYLFSPDQAVQDRVIERTSSGGVTVNHVTMHFIVPGLPFGGVGESGMGAYHGRGTFDVFTHRKGVLRKPTAMDPPIAYPPFTESKAKWVKRLL